MGFDGWLTDVTMQELQIASHLHDEWLQFENAFQHIIGGHPSDSEFEDKHRLGITHVFARSADRPNVEKIRRGDPPAQKLSPALLTSIPNARIFDLKIIYFHF